MDSKQPIEITFSQGYDASTVTAPQYASKSAEGSIQEEQLFRFKDSRKLGVTSAVFLILNKMIGTGSKYHVFYLLLRRI